MKKYIGILLTGLMICQFLTGCTTDIKPDTKQQGVYATQTPLSSIEYSIYMNKQITVYANQITTRLIMIKNAQQECIHENEAELAEESLKIMKDVLEEVTVTYPSDTSNDDRLTTIETMQSALDHMQSYVESVRNKESLDGYILVFENDFNALTGLANLYYQ